MFSAAFGVVDGVQPVMRWLWDSREGELGDFQ